jgi:hypothetical protein
MSTDPMNPHDVPTQPPLAAKDFASPMHFLCYIANLGEYMKARTVGGDEDLTLILDRGMAECDALLAHAPVEECRRVARSAIELQLLSAIREFGLDNDDENHRNRQPQTNYPAMTQAILTEDGLLDYIQDLASYARATVSQAQQGISIHETAQEHFRTLLEPLTPEEKFEAASLIFDLLVVHAVTPLYWLLFRAVMDRKSERS